jgi:PKD repeat protein
MNKSRKVIIQLAGLFVLALLTTAVEAQTVTRGPYLQMQSDHGVTIRWRTSTATDSVVRFGDTPGNLASSAVVSGTRTEHTVNLAGLPAAQQFFYSVGNISGPLAGDSTYHFHTAPTAGVAADTRIWVIGDSGTANADAVNVYNAFRTWSASDPADFWLMLGDNAYNSGTDVEYQAAVFNIYPEFLRQLPLWATLGNHDAGSASSTTQSGPYYSIFDFPKNAEVGGWPSGTEAYYSFDYANIHFINLNSQDVSRAVNGSMMQWLQADLASNNQPWVIAFWHHPPYTKGSHNSDTETQLIDMRQNALPMLEAWGVDLVLTGHSHSYERSYLLDGHYGLSTTLNPVTNVLDPGDGRANSDGVYEKPGIVAAEHAGAVYAVAGSSGKISGGTLDHPAMFVSLNNLGSLVVDVSGNRMDVVFLNQAGEELDEFSVIKTPDSDPPLISAASASDATHVLVDFDEPLNSTQAINAANYSIAGLTISQAELLAGDRTVRLTTSAMTNGAAYTLMVNDLRDLADNIILPGSSIGFDFFELFNVAFQDGLAPTPAYAGTRDGYIRQASPTTVHGLETTLQVDGDEPAGTLTDMNILLSWDISAIPVDAILEAAYLELEVTDISTGTYTCYSLLKAWQESQATWNLAASAAPWSTAGAAGASDRGAQPLCTVSAGVLGQLTVNFTQAGLDLAQSWINNPSGNNGMIISNTSTTDGADFYSRESANAMSRPRLEVTYRVPVVPVNNAPVADYLNSCTNLACSFTDTSSDSDGTLSSWAWDFGDGATATSQNPSHTFASAGNYTVSLTVTDDDGASDSYSELVVVTAPPAFVDQVASADLPLAGTVSGTYVATHADGGAVQSITERLSGGKPSKSYSYLSHTWQFSVVPGSPITLYANAWSGGSSDGDSFKFAWSSNNSTFTDLFTLPVNDFASVQSVTIPSSGTIYIRVTDTNRTVGATGLDTVFVDQLYIRSNNGTPASPPVAPTDLQTSSPTSSALTLSWQHPSTDETSFDIERSPDGATNWAQVASPGGGSSSYTNTGLSASTTYFYRIRARNSAGVSAWSVNASGVTSPASTISLTAGGRKVQGFHVIDLSWSGAGGAVSVIRDSVSIATTASSTYTDNTGNKGARTYVYRVCLTGSSACSNDAVVVF